MDVMHKILYNKCSCFCCLLEAFASFGVGRVFEIKYVCISFFESVDQQIKFSAKQAGAFPVVG